MREQLKRWTSESGAIMLEVVAVLSLMGLMGVMLFRQIYLRNQELHNIQMASEIRVVKEGFAAWIQAESTHMAAYCAVGPDLDDANVCDVGAAQLDEIKDFLPEGYFTTEGAGVLDRGAVLADNYILKLVGYRRGTSASNILTYYGVVLPNPETLPDEGRKVSAGGTWSFRRAARVAMLIGVDGGAYDADVTGGEIAGALGTWHLPISGLIDAGDAAIPTYAAITAVDVFQPEVELPSLKIGLPASWDLALHNSTAYGSFSAGNATNCYIVSPNRLVDVEMQDGAVATLNSDTITTPLVESTCRPAFFVEGSGEAVYVLNDLRVGHDYGTNQSSIRFDKDGMILFEKDSEIDPQSTAADKHINYKLDPKYTSVMNDIKIMSRGGAALSEILPTYIHKDSRTWECLIAANSECSSDWPTGASLPISFGSNACYCVLHKPSVPGENEIPFPDCPKGYVKALVIRGISSSSGGAAQEVVTGVDLTPGVMAATAGHVIGDMLHPAFRTIEESTGWKVYTGYITERTGVTARLKNKGQMWVGLDSYCVFDPAQVDWDGDGIPGGGTAPTKDRPLTKALCCRIKAENPCQYMGCHWDAGHSLCERVDGEGCTP